MRHQGHNKEDHQDHGRHMEEFKRRFWVSLVLTVPILLLSEMIQTWLRFTLEITFQREALFLLSLIVYLYGGWPFIKGMGQEIKKRQPGMMTLIGTAISVAFFYSAATVFVIVGKDFFWELATLIDVMLLGHWIEAKSVLGASRALEELVKIMPTTAHLERNGKIEDVPISQLKADHIVLVRPGEKIPSDGVVIEGESFVNEALLTGESKPVHKEMEDQVIGGAINGEGVLKVRIEKTGEETCLAQVIQLVRQAQERVICRPLKLCHGHYKVSVLARSEYFHAPKVAVIGVGFVGSSFAYSVMIHGTVSEVVLIDIDKKRAEGEAMDLNHGLSFVRPARIWAGNYPDCEGADIVVIAAGVAQRPGESRLKLVRRNVEIFRQIIPKIKEYNKECILLIATNPVDVMTYASLKLSGFPKSRVIGSGTILDTSRLRYLLGEYLRVDPRNVHAYIIGEHGDSEVPVWSLANIAGTRLKEYCPVCGQKYDEQYLNTIFEQVKNSAYKIIELKGRTYYAIGLGLTRIVESIIRDENAVLTVSSLLQDYYGVSAICLSVPTIVNRDGVREVLKLPLEEEEIKQFQNSASILKNITQSLDL